MSTGPAWVHRFRSRWRKWWRDPAGFADDLPSTPLRAAAVFGLAGFTLISDAADRTDARARRLWLQRGVALRHSGSDAAEFAFLDRDGRAPELWPDRVLMDGGDAEAVVVAFGKRGGPITAAELGPGRPGLIALRGGPATAKVYCIDNTAAPPAELKARPLSRADIVRRLQGEGIGLAECMRAAWTPIERRQPEPTHRAYQAWIARNEPSVAELEVLRARIAARTDLPRIAVLMPVHDPRPAHLKAAIASVRAQVYGGWTLCIADDGSRSNEVRRIIADAANDPRVRVMRLEASAGVSAATNVAMDLAEGDIVLFLDHDDLLAPHALALVAEAMAARPEAAAIYSDEDTIDSDGRRSAPVFKPELDRERLLAQNYVNHLFAVRLELLRRLGGLRPEYDGVQDHDLVLRLVESGAGPVLHLPHVLYHWRIFPGGGSFSQTARARLDPKRAKAVAGHLERTHRHAELRPGPRGHLLVSRALPEPAPEVAAIIPTRDRPALLRLCVAGLLEQTDYPSLKVCIVDNGSHTRAALELLEDLARLPRVQLLRIDGPFNFAALNNAAVKACSSQVLAFINDDIMVVEPGWLKALAAMAVDPNVGAVGAKLFYPDGRIQHAGIVLGLGPQGVAGHEFRGAPADAPGPQNRLLLGREASAVTAACMVVERRKFEAVGGFDEEAFPVAFNDVDLCLRLAARGWRTLWSPQARLMHLESATRGSDRAEASHRRFAGEARRMHERWGPKLSNDPYYSPNLTLEDESFTLADRSRAPAPWR